MSLQGMKKTLNFLSLIKEQTLQPVEKASEQANNFLKADFTF